MHTRNMENRAQLKKPNKSLENIYKAAHQLDIHDKDFKTAVFNMFKSDRKTQRTKGNQGKSI